MDWSLIWTIIGSIASVLAIIGSLAVWITNSFRNQLRKQFEPVIEQNTKLAEENEKLRKDIETRLKLPSFSLDAIKLTEIATEKRIEEITNNYNKALLDKDQALADTLQKQIEEINRLKNQIEQARQTQTNAQANLQSVLSRPQVHFGTTAVGLPTGLILLVRCNSRYGALQMIDQSSVDSGSKFRYVWWYQPDGKGTFTNYNTLTGCSEDAITSTNGSPKIKIGPIELMWSECYEGIGWVYFGPSSTPSSDIEFCVTNEINIRNIDAVTLHGEFFSHDKMPEN